MNNSDKIILDGWELPIKVGESPEEKSFPQIIKVNLTLYLPLSEAGKNDDLLKTVDYAQVIEEIKSETNNAEYNLIEAVGELISQVVLKNKLVEAVTVNVSKKSFPGIKQCSIEIHRSNTR